MVADGGRAAPAGGGYTMANRPTTPEPEGRAYQGDMTPMRPEEATIDPLSAELGLTPEVVGRRTDERTVADGELPADERRTRGIEDNVRHVDGIGRR
jgi:hypothetical protein